MCEHAEVPALLGPLWVLISMVYCVLLCPIYRNAGRHADRRGSRVGVACFAGMACVCLRVPACRPVVCLDPQVFTRHVAYVQGSGVASRGHTLMVNISRGFVPRSESQLSDPNLNPKASQ